MIQFDESIVRSGSSSSLATAGNVALAPVPSFNELDKEFMDKDTLDGKLKVLHLRSPPPPDPSTGLVHITPSSSSAPSSSSSSRGAVTPASASSAAAAGARGGAGAGAAGKQPSWFSTFLRWAFWSQNRYGRMLKRFGKGFSIGAGGSLVFALVPLLLKSRLNPFKFVSLLRSSHFTSSFRFGAFVGTMLVGFEVSR